MPQPTLALPLRPPGFASVNSTPFLVSHVIFAHRKIDPVLTYLPPWMEKNNYNNNSAGIGLETSRQLYQRGATVILGCRSKTRASEAMRTIDPDRVNGSGNGGGNDGRLRSLHLDLTSFASVREAARTFLSTGAPLHVLINNAGVMRRLREVTPEDGIEITMAANHLGHFLLTHLLLPKLRESAAERGRPSRVITVSSSLHLNARRRRRVGVGGDGGESTEPGIDLSDLQCENRGYSLFEQYAQSKLANLMFAIELGRRERRRWQHHQQKQLLLQPRRRTKPLEEEDGHLIANEMQITPKLKAKKTLRPKLTPVDDLPMDDDEIGLGFNDIASTPPQRKKKNMPPKLTPVDNPSPMDKDEVGLGLIDIAHTPPQRERKKSRPKLTPVDDPSLMDDDDEIGLGFNDIASTPPQKEKKKSRPKLTPVDDPFPMDDDDAGLGFNDIAHMPPSVTNESISEVSEDDEEADEGELESKMSSNHEKVGAGARPKLVHALPTLSSYEDETGLGLHDVVVSTPPSTPQSSKKKRARPKLIPASSSLSSYDDDMGLGFHDVAVSMPQSTPMEKENEVCPTSMRPVRSSNDEKDDEEGGQEHNNTTTILVSTANHPEESWKSSFPPVMSYCVHPGLVRTNVV